MEINLSPVCEKHQARQRGQALVQKAQNAILSAQRENRAVISVTLTAAEFDDIKQFGDSIGASVDRLLEVPYKVQG